IVLSLILVLLCIVPALGYYDLGSPKGYVNDYTNTLTLEQKNSLEGKISNYEKESSNEVVVVIIDNLEGDYIENFAVKLFEAWGIGKEENDNGILLLVALQEKQMRIEVGYGLEGALTDAEASWVIQEMIPYFQQGEYFQGIDMSVDRMIAITKGEFEVPLDAQEGDSPTSLTIGFILFYFFGFFILPIILYKLFPHWTIWNLARISSGHGFSGWRGPGGSSGGGGFGGFGGGRSGGGGSSGSW
nr:TPM domain-containing protein [Candidatus Dojkabacteria bacterium]